MRIRRIARRINDSILNEVNETGKILSTVCVRRRNIMRHVWRHTDALLHILIEVRTGDKIDRR